MHCRTLQTPLQSLILINESAAVFMALQVALCVAKFRLTSKCMCVFFCLISRRMNMFLRCNVDMTLLHAATWISTQHESTDRNLAQRNTGNCLTITRSVVIIYPVLRASKQKEMANFNKRLLSCLYLPLIGFIFCIPS